jgi:hypothetical protein
MSAPTNAARVASADAALLAYRTRTRCDAEDSLGDLLCDLMHWADKYGFAFNEAFERAHNHYHAERTDGESHGEGV